MQTIPPSPDQHGTLTAAARDDEPTESQREHPGRRAGGEISRENWGVPVQGLTHADPEGIVRLVACRDGSVILHLSCADTQGSVRLDISRAAQLSTGIWEAAGAGQQLTRRLDDDRLPAPQSPSLPTGSGDSPVA